ncbi:hypothetical protein [Brachyspira sp.]|uniref:hypothetical protein n=1 Tax=Brachyspira sp. TaxID=1977261 RepID=UPI003D7DB43A
MKKIFYFFIFIGIMYIIYEIILYIINNPEIIVIFLIAFFIIIFLCSLIKKENIKKRNSSTNSRKFNSVNKKCNQSSKHNAKNNNNSEVTRHLIGKAIELGLTDKAFEYGKEYLVKKFINKPKTNETSFQNDYEVYSETKNGDETKQYNESQNNNKNINKKVGTAYLECIKKIKDIRDIIKDFDYSDNKTYGEEILDIENNINKELKIIDNVSVNIAEVNKVIDRINIIYRNAYNKKNNVSSLSYVMETDEEDIDLINKIDIDNL